MTRRSCRWLRAALSVACAVTLLGPTRASAAPGDVDSPYRVSVWIMPVPTVLHAAQRSGLALPIGVNLAPRDYGEVMIEATFLYADYPLSSSRADLKHSRGLILAAGPVFRFRNPALRGLMLVVTPKVQFAGIRTAYSGPTFASSSPTGEPIDQEPQSFAHLAVDAGIEWNRAPLSLTLLGGVGAGYCVGCRASFFDPYSILDRRPFQSRRDGPNFPINTNLLRVAATF